MWIFTPTAMVSIVAHRQKPSVLLVRARLKGDIQRLFPRAKVTTTPAADYRFRAEVPRSRVARVLADQALALAYDNVKGAVPKKGRVHDLRASMMSRCWQAAFDAQRQDAGLALLPAGRTEPSPVEPEGRWPFGFDDKCLLEPGYGYPSADDHGDEEAFLQDLAAGIVK